MSTFTDGAPPSVSPGPDEPSGPDNEAAQAQAAPGGGAPDGADWLRAEIQRRIAAKSVDGGGARHARRGNPSTSNGIGYVPRHSVGPPLVPPAAPPAAPPAPTPRPTPRPMPSRRPAEPPPTSGFPVAAPAPVPPAAETGPVPQLQKQDVTPQPAPAPATPPPAKPNGQPTGPNPVIAPLRVAPPTEQATPVGPPVAELLPQTGRTGVPHRPAPPAGPAVARLLSPPTTPPSTPTGIPLEPGSGVSSTTPVPAVPPRIGPRPTASPELEASGEVLWSSLTPPEAGVAGARRVTLPMQRGPEPHRAETDTATGGFVAVAAAAVGTAPSEADAEPERGEEPIKRVRVVLAERKAIARPVRTVQDVQEGTGVGEVLRRNLIRSQLRVALTFAAGAVLTLGLLPLAFAFLPEIGRLDVLGIRLPWLLLGGLVYPFLLGLGWWHTRTAERVEQNFADHVQD